MAKYTKFEQMSRVGSRDRHAWWRSKIACEKVFKFCTESVIAQRLFEKNPESDFKPDPLKLIVHGGAGIINWWNIIFLDEYLILIFCFRRGKVIYNKDDVYFGWKNFETTWPRSKQSSMHLGSTYRKNSQYHRYLWFFEILLKSWLFFLY